MARTMFRLECDEDGFGRHRIYRLTSDKGYTESQVKVMLGFMRFKGHVVGFHGGWDTKLCKYIYMWRERETDL